VCIEQFQRQVITNVIDVILVYNVCDFVQLYARLLRVNFRFPAYVNDDDTFVCGVDNCQYGETNVSSRSEKHRYELQWGTY
jgi:hypothetical protein